MRIRLACMTATIAMAATACVSGGAAGDAPASSANSSSRTPALAAGYSPQIDPVEFVARIDNPLFTLEPGTVFRLRGETEDATEHETITVTHRTKEILGVATTVVKDVLEEDGRVTELTYDWYAQDRDGNVWYFGEDTAEYENGKVVSREGSWESGVHGAQPGIIMNAHPQVTDSFRQEYYKGSAEDMYWVVSTDASVTVPFGRFENLVKTIEWTPLEPKVVTEKLYAPRVGLVAERALSGPKQVVELLDVERP